MDVAAVPAQPEFSLVEGGPLRRLARRVRVGGRPLGPLGLGIGLALLAWLPLLCLATLERLGTGPGGTVSFLGSLSTHIRFLVTLPLVFATEVWVDPASVTSSRTRSPPGWCRRPSFPRWSAPSGSPAGSGSRRPPRSCSRSSR